MSPAFLPNPDFEREFVAEEETREGLARLAEPARELADNFSPHIMRRRGPQFQLVIRDDGVYLVDTAHGGAIEEWGSRNNAPFAPLRRGVLGAGFRLEEVPAP